MRISAVPRRCCRSEIRPRICAWMVTSSAVVGSSATMILRIAGERQRDHGALAHAARQFVRDIAGRGARGSGICTSCSVSMARCIGLRCGRALRCWRTDFGDLLADGQHRVERGQRLLEDHGDLLAAKVLDLALRPWRGSPRHRCGSSPRATLRRFGQQPQQRQRGHRLAAAGFRRRCRAFRPAAPSAPCRRRPGTSRGRRGSGSPDPRRRAPARR